MKESQIEIQAIQAKLQALQMGRTAMHQPTPTEDKPATEAIDWREPYPAPSRLPSDRPKSVIETQRLSSRETSALLRQLHLPEAATPPAEAMPRGGEASARLEAQIDQIHELAIAQESALIELKNLAEAIDRERKLDLESDDLPTCEFLAAAVPLIERDRDGVFVVSTRPIDLFRAERDAVSIAKNLRSRRPPISRHRRRRSRSFWDKLTDFDMPERRPPAAPSNLTLADAAVWIIGAIVVRVGLDLLLSSFPHLWLPVAGLIVLPAAIAIYRTTFTPETGFAWGYRLFLAMIGLLIGGRFY